jgi:hypothetical protein
MSTEIEETAKRLKDASETILTSAASLKSAADQLRADVDALTGRVTAIENNTSDVADTLVESNLKGENQQGVQDGRLDNLETNGS